ncbi:MAG: NAD-dependent epimerase/dehydratase family protein, partial [Polyangia bacterium]
MRIFVTGATGFIGSATVRELIGAGHSVLGLARSDAAAASLENAGGDVHRGALSDPASLVAGARACDGVIHTAFIHDFARTTIAEAAVVDARVVEALCAALEGSGKALAIASGTALLPAGRLVTEADVPVTGAPRGPSEATIQAASDRGVRANAVRLPPTVHGTGDHGFVPMLIDIARRTGVAAYVGDGTNRWPAVHRFDAARVFRLTVETAASG